MTRGADLQGLPLPVTPATPFKACLPPLAEIGDLVTDNCPGPLPLGSPGFQCLGDKQGKLGTSTDFSLPFQGEQVGRDVERRKGAALSLSKDPSLLQYMWVLEWEYLGSNLHFITLIYVFLNELLLQGCFQPPVK